MQNQQFTVQSTSNEKHRSKGGSMHGANSWWRRQYTKIERKSRREKSEGQNKTNCSRAMRLLKVDFFQAQRFQSQALETYLLVTHHRRISARPNFACWNLQKSLHRSFRSFCVFCPFHLKFVTCCDLCHSNAICYLDWHRLFDLILGKRTINWRSQWTINWRWSPQWKKLE